MPETSTYNSLFIVDVEATSPTPMTGHMTEFGVVHVVTGESFYAKLYKFTPHPDIPALPVVVTDNGKPVNDVRWVITGEGGTDESVGVPPDSIAHALKVWLDGFGVAPKLVSDNNGFDAMWLNCFTDAAGVGLLFGHSSRRIGDFYAGTKGNWSDQSSWKRLRETPHTHNPVDDAQGNREALLKILGDGTPNTAVEVRFND